MQQSSNKKHLILRLKGAGGLIFYEKVDHETLTKAEHLVQKEGISLYKAIEKTSNLNKY